LEATQGKHSIDSLQNTAAFVTSNIIRTVLQWRSLVVQEKYQEKRLMTSDNNNNNNKIIIIIYP
jgi:hypothetical protein